MTDADPARPSDTVRVSLPTSAGVFDVRAFELTSGHVYVAMCRGDLADREDVLCRVHSECLTGDALGSLRCDCGVQLRQSLRLIEAEERGVLLYVTGHEGRGIGLINKLRAYVAQDRGVDTVDANVQLGLPVDARSYDDAAEVLRRLGVRSVRLLTNNPAKVTGLRAAGMPVTRTVPLPTASHNRNGAYLRTKERRLGHVRPAGPRLDETSPTVLSSVVDVGKLLGDPRPRPERPYVVLKYAQTLDGRIATGGGDSRWISGEDERRVSHALRAACDSVLVGAGTVAVDDPMLTVRMVPGASPRRVILDSTLRTPPTARVLDGEAATTVVTTARADPERRAELRRRGIDVPVVAEGPDGRVDLRAALRTLREAGTQSVLVEGGGHVLTAMLAAGVVDRVIVAIAPVIIGQGVEAVGTLGIARVADGVQLVNRSVHAVGDDVIVAGDVAGPGTHAAP